MADDVVVAFLSNLKEDKAARERIEEILLAQVVEFANRKGYDFLVEDFKGCVKVDSNDGIPDLLKWPITR